MSVLCWVDVTLTAEEVNSWLIHEPRIPSNEDEIRSEIECLSAISECRRKFMSRIGEPAIAALMNMPRENLSGEVTLRLMLERKDQ